MSFLDRLSAWFHRVFSDLPVQSVPATPSMPFVSQLLQLHNDIRRRQSLTEFLESLALTGMALTQTEHMALAETLSHDINGSLSSRIQRSGFHFMIVGENIAAGQRTPEDVFSAWMTSTGHRENICNPYFTQVGLACKQSAAGHMFWCVIFAGAASKSLLASYIINYTAGPVDDRPATGYTR